MDDLHDGNVFVDGDRLRVFDWGDASVAHPFVSLGMILATAAEGLALPRTDAAIERVRDAYLEPFADLASPVALRAAAALAERVTPTVRILAWQLAHEGVPPEDQAGEWGGDARGADRPAACSDRRRARLTVAASNGRDRGSAHRRSHRVSLWRGSARGRRGSDRARRRRPSRY